jgi:hypothetical protein
VKSDAIGVDSYELKFEVVSRMRLPAEALLTLSGMFTSVIGLLPAAS